MNDTDATNFDDDRIRSDAAGWIVRLAGRHSARDRQGLDRWLSADPRHAAAYDRAADRFDQARILRRSKVYVARPAPVYRGARTAVIAGALALGTLASAFLISLIGPVLPSVATVRDRRAVAAKLDALRVVSLQRIETTISNIKSVGLPDGSVVTLDHGSVVEASLSPMIRRLTLLRGRARFSVARDGRPFVVSAGGGSVTARGTMFDVVLKPGGGVAVTLLHGVVDVTPVAGAVPDTTRSVRRLQAGQGIAYWNSAIPSRPGAWRARDVRWIAGAVDFDNVSLGYVLEAATRGVGPRISVADPAIAELRVSGRFDVNDRNRLANNLARLFDLRATLRPGGIELARH